MSEMPNQDSFAQAGDELTFDEAAAPTRRAPRRGVAAPSASAASVAAPLPETSDLPGPAAAPVVGGPGRLVTIALVMAVVASLFSAVGLLVASRTIVQASLASAEAEKRQAQLGRVPAMMERLERVLARQERSLDRGEETSSTARAATLADLRREIDGLKLGIANYQPADSSALAEIVRDGQSEIAERLDAMAERIGRAERRPVSPSPKASRAGDRARPS